MRKILIVGAGKSSPYLIKYLLDKSQEEELLITQIDDLKHKILLIEKNDHDYLDILFREKFKQGTKDDIIIKLR